jgi:ribonuclease P protein subunit RPR2
MSRVARQRIGDLFVLAEAESRGHAPYADRYVALARKIGARYNVRLPREYRELHCRGCSVYWVEGRTVRTRIRSGRRVRTCLRCGRIRRTRIRTTPARSAAPESGELLPAEPTEGALAEDEAGGRFEDEGEPEEDA